MRFDGLLGEEESHADLAIHETIRDQLENLDLARSRLLLQLLRGPENGMTSAPPPRRFATASNRRLWST